MKLTKMNLHTQLALRTLRSLLFSAALITGASVWAFNSSTTRPALAAWAGKAAQATGQASRVGKLLAAAVTRLSSSAPLAGTISGKVFQDLNANGLMDPAQVVPYAREAELGGVAGVTVTAYNADRKSVV